MTLKDQLAQLQAKTEDYTIKRNGSEIITLKLQGISFPELTEVATYADNDDTKGLMNYLLFQTLRKSLPTQGEDGMTDVDVREMITTLDSSVGAEILKRARELSGLEGDEKNDDGVKTE